MKYDRQTIKEQTCTIFLITNLCVSLVLGNLHVVNNQQTVNNTFKNVDRAIVHPLVISQDILLGQIGNLMGRPGEGYYMQVEIGSPPQKLNVLIDTGSSNLAVACAPNADITSYFHRENSSTFKDLGRKVDVPYTQGSWNGVLGRDQITLATFPNSTVNAHIACINEATGFFINGSNWQGIMGLGYAAIARERMQEKESVPGLVCGLYPALGIYLNIYAAQCGIILPSYRLGDLLHPPSQPDSSVEPFFDSLVQGRGVMDIFSVQLCGLGYTKPNVNNTVGGSVIFGGIVPSLYRSQLYSTPIMKEQYFEVVIIDILVANESLNMDCKEYNFDRTIVDTGTTNFRLPRRVFNKLISLVKQSYGTAITNTSMKMPSDGFWNGKEVLCWRTGKVQYDLFPTVSVTLPSGNGKSFTLEVAPQQYLRPVGEENDDSILDDCFKLGISASDTGSVIGAIVMEGFYIVFDRVSKQIQFAESACGVVDDKAAKSNITGYRKYSGDYTDCAYIKIDPKNKTLTIVGYVFAGLCALCVIPMLVLVVQWQCRRSRCRRLRRSNSDANDLMEGQ